MSIEEAGPLEPTDVAARSTDAEGFLAAADAIAKNPDEHRFDELEVAESGRVFERYTAPVRGLGGERIERTTVIREVTAEREAERLKNDLMATVSHELRTPLARIVGFTELMLTRDPEPDVRRAHLSAGPRPARASSGRNTAASASGPRRCRVGAWLGGVVLAAGLGLAAPMWVAVGLTLAGMAIFTFALLLERRHHDQGASS